MNKPGAYRVYLLYTCLQAVFFAMMATYNLVYFTTVVGMNPLQLVLVGTVLETTVFLCEVPTGIVADVYSRRLSIIIGVFVIGIGFTLQGAVPTVAAAMLSQVIWGLGYTFTSGATTAWITDEIGEARVGPALLRGSQAGRVGGIIGIVIGTALATAAVHLPVLLSGILFMALALWLAVAMPETGFRPTPRAERSTWAHLFDTFREGLKLVRARPALIMLLAVSAVWGMTSEGYDRLWQKNLLDNFTLPALGPVDPVAWFGVLGLVSSFAGIGATEWARRHIDTARPQALARALLVISALLALSVAGFALVGQFGLAALAVLVIDTLRSVNGPLFETWLNQNIDSRVRATVLSITSQADALGQITGGPAVGYIGLRVSMRTAIFAAGLLLSPVVLLYGRALRRETAGEELAVS